MGRQVPIRAGVGASSPIKGEFLTAKLTFIDAMQGAFRSPPAPLRIATRSNRAPHRAASPSSAPESARQTPSRGISYGKVVFYRCNAGGFPLAPCTPSDRSRRENTGGFPRGKQSARQAPPKRNSLGRGFALRSEHVLPAVHSPSPKNDRHVPKHAGRFSLAASVSPVAHRRMALYFSAQTACTFSMAFCTSSSVRVRSAARKVREKATLFLPSPT